MSHRPVDWAPLVDSEFFTLERGEELAADAAAVLDTLRVTLEEAPR